MAHALQLKKNSVAEATEVISSQPALTPNWIKRCIVRFKAKRRVNKIMQSLHEAKKIHAGRKSAPTFEEFLNNL